MSGSQERGVLAGVLLGTAIVGTILVVGAFIVAVRALRTPPKPVPPPPPVVVLPAPEPEPPPLPPPEPSLPPAPPPPPPSVPPPPAPPTDSGETRQAYVRVQKLTQRINLAGLVATVLYLSGRTDEFLKVRTEVLRMDREIRALIREYERHPDFRSFPVRYEPGDTIVGFGPAALAPQDPKPFVERVSAWLRTYQPGGAVVVTLSRQGGELTVPFYFPERNEDLKPLLDRIR